MPTFDVTALLANTDFTLDGIVSTSYPDGKAYTFPSPSASRGMWMREMVQAGIRAQLTGKADRRLAALDEMDEAQELDLYRDVLGSDTLDELVADGVSWVAVQRIFGLLLRHYATDRDIRRELAELTESVAPATQRPSATPARKRAARKAPAKKASARRTPARTTGENP